MAERNLPATVSNQDHAVWRRSFAIRVPGKRSSPADEGRGHAQPPWRSIWNRAAIRIRALTTAWRILQDSPSTLRDSSLSASQRGRRGAPQSPRDPAAAVQEAPTISRTRLRFPQIGRRQALRPAHDETPFQPSRRTIRSCFKHINRREETQHRAGSSSNFKCSTECGPMLQKKLVEQGHRLRLVHFLMERRGCPFFMRRLAERPANVSLQHHTSLLPLSTCDPDPALPVSLLLSSPDSKSRFLASTRNDRCID